MLYEWWERYRRIAIAAAVILFVGISIWLYHAQQAGTTANLPLQEAFASVGDGQSASGETSASVEPPSTAGTQQHLSDPPGAVGAVPAPRQDVAHQGQPRDTGAPPLFVDVKGKVKQPGLYQFEAGARVADAIARAGGPAPDADVEQINLAEPLTDGSAVLVPAKGSPASPCGQAAAHSAIVETVGTGSSLGSAAAGSSTGASGGGKAGGAQPVNLNTASLEELMTLPGIGEARAKAILAYRTENGAFRSPEELKRISGIGDKMYQRLKDHIRVR